MKLNLKNVTLVCVASDYKKPYVNMSVKAIEICQNFADFGAVKFFTDMPIDTDLFEVHRILPITSIQEYNKFMLMKLPYVIDTDYCLVIQYDGFIVNPYAWTDDFLKYDYIGANGFLRFGRYMPVNGGFSLRSRKFLHAQKMIISNLELDNFEVNEDLLLVDYLRHYFESMGIKFATNEIADKFSTENGNYDDNKSFGFHDFHFNLPYKILAESQYKFELERQKEEFQKFKPIEKPEDVQI